MELLSLIAKLTTCNLLENISIYICLYHQTGVLKTIYNDRLECLIVPIFITFYRSWLLYVGSICFPSNVFPKVKFTEGNFTDFQLQCSTLYNYQRTCTIMRKYWNTYRSMSFCLYLWWNMYECNANTFTEFDLRLCNAYVTKCLRCSAVRFIDQFA